MKRIISTLIQRSIVLLFASTLLISCDQQSSIAKDFVWDEDVKELTGGNLDTWLSKAPFNNELKRFEKDQIFITNTDQVFPFKGRYYNAVEELARDYGPDTLIFQETDILFQDSVWGDLFLDATLLYDDQEVFLRESYLEIGSRFFGGVSAVTDFGGLGAITGVPRSSLYETSVVAKHPKYKTGIYWVSANYQRYLLGFYQQGQLVFETVVPFQGDTLATLNKLKEINTSQGLNIPEWENAEVSDLQEVDQPKTFWQDPFEGIYPIFPIYEVYLKIKDTPFVQDDEARKGDYYFSFPGNGGDVFFYTLMQQTELNKDDFNKENKKLDRYRYIYEDIFYEEHADNGYVKGIAKTYFKGKKYLEIHFAYPETDDEAKQQVHGVLRYIKMFNYEG